MNLSVIGVGYVGLVTSACFAKLGHRVVGIDNNPDKLKKLSNGQSPFFEPGLSELLQKQIELGRISFDSEISTGIKDADIIFIAVGTYPLPDGSPDMSQVDKVAAEIANNLTGKHAVIVQKSTVPPGTGKRLTGLIKQINPEAQFDIISNPEFLREGTAIEDTLNPDRVVVGGASKKALLIMKELFQPITSGANCPYLETDIATAELVKYTANAFLATKISFINFISLVCEKLGADINLVAKGIGLDKRIGHRFLKAGIGFGGSCLPKDVNAFIHLVKNNNLDSALLESVEDINKTQQKNFVEKIRQNVNLSGATVGILGLAFKPNTDDVREAPAVYIINELLKSGASVKAFDPEAMETASPVLPDITMTENAYAVAEDADALIVCTEWKEFLSLDFERIKKLMNKPLIFDGRNCLNDRTLNKLGFVYHAIGKRHP